MNKLYSLLLVIILSSCTAVIPPKELPLGAWKYRLYINGIKSGTASMSIAQKDNTYVSTLTLALKQGFKKYHSHQIVIENLDGSPVYLEIDNINEDKNKKFRLRTKTYFRGNSVRVITEKNNATVELRKQPHIDGVFFMLNLIKRDFKIGTEIKTNLYDPTVEVEETIPASMKVIGFDRHRIRGSLRKLIHLRMNIDGIRSTDIFINEKGIRDLIIIKMLNNTINLVRQ